MSDVKKITSNLIWRFLERTGAQLVTLLVSIILARILEPEVYGTVALVTVFTTILNVFIDSGLVTAKNKKKDADDLDFSTVFYFNIFACIIFYLVLFFLAPVISGFYKLPQLVSIVRVLGVTLFIAGVKGVQVSFVSKNLLFKKFFFSTLGGTVVASFFGIIMAYKGFGVWALVAQSLINNFIDTLILWVTVEWRPKLQFSFKRLKGLFSYGWKLLASGLLDTLYNKVRQLIIGKMYTSEDLAFYTKGSLFPDVIVTNINSSIDSVLLPSMSEEQDNIVHVKEMTRRAIKIGTYIIMPMMMGLAVCAEPIVTLVLTEKWLPCVPYLRVFCFTNAFYPIHSCNLNAIKALGRSDLFFKLEIIKKIVGMVALLSTMWFGVMPMAYSLLFTSVTSQIINSWPNKKLLNYSYLEQLKDMLPQIILSFAMGFIVFLENYIPINAIFILFIQVSTGIFIYVFGSKIFKIDSFNYIIYMIKRYKKNK